MSRTRAWDLVEFFYDPITPVPDHLIPLIIKRCLVHRESRDHLLRYVRDWCFGGDEIYAQELKQMVENEAQKNHTRTRMSRNEDTDEVERQVRRLKYWLVNEMEMTDV